MIKDEIQAEFTDAMKSKDAPRRDVIRQINSEVATRKAAPGFDGDDGDDFYVAVIGSYVKKMDKSRQEYESFGERGAEMAAKLAYEVEYLSRWLPTKLDEDATRALVDKVVADLGVAGDPKAKGRVMGMLMKDHKDDLDGGLVNRIVSEALAES